MTSLFLYLYSIQCSAQIRWYRSIRVWIFPRRLAASANATDLAVNVRIFLIKDRE